MVENAKQLREREIDKTDAYGCHSYCNDERYESNGEGTDDDAERICPIEVVGDEGTRSDLCGERYEIGKDSPFDCGVPKFRQDRIFAFRV